MFMRVLMEKATASNCVPTASGTRFPRESGSASHPYKGDALATLAVMLGRDIQIRRSSIGTQFGDRP